MTAPFSEQTVTFHCAYPMEGTLAIPAAAGSASTSTTPSASAPTSVSLLPAVLIIPGTGKGDRDGNLPKQKLMMNLYKDLSDALAREGYMTLRFDKRGVGRSGGDYYETGLWDLVDDAAEAVKFLKNHPLADAERVFILGHSEGAILAPAVHLKEAAAGLILLSGTAEAAADAAKKQFDEAMKALSELKGFQGFLIRLFNVEKKARKQNAKLWERIMSSDRDWFRVQGVKLNAKWMREHQHHSVLDDMKRTDCPVLAVTGSKDRQVTPEDARTIAETACGESEWHIVDGVNHILRRQDRDVSMLSLIKEYKREAKAGEPIDPRVLSLVTGWLNRQRDGR